MLIGSPPSAITCGSTSADEAGSFTIPWLPSRKGSIRNCSCGFTARRSCARTSSPVSPATRQDAGSRDCRTERSSLSGDYILIEFGQSQGADRYFSAFGRSLYPQEITATMTSPAAAEVRRSRRTCCTASRREAEEAQQPAPVKCGIELALILQ